MTVSQRILLIRTLSAEMVKVDFQIDELTLRLKDLNRALRDLQATVNTMGEDEPELDEFALAHPAESNLTTEAA